MFKFNVVLVSSLLLALNTFHTSLNVFIVNFEQINTGWEEDSVFFQSGFGILLSSFGQCICSIF